MLSGNVVHLAGTAHAACFDVIAAALSDAAFQPPPRAWIGATLAGGCVSAWSRHAKVTDVTAAVRCAICVRTDKRVGIVTPLN
jgi:hypothetical protein